MRSVLAKGEIAKDTVIVLLAKSIIIVHHKGGCRLVNDWLKKSNGKMLKKNRSD